LLLSVYFFLHAFPFSSTSLTPNIRSNSSSYRFYFSPTPSSKSFLLSSIFPFLLFPEFSQYSDWLWAGWPRDRSSSPERVKNVFFSISSRPTLGPAQPPIQWVPRLFPQD
jgi:hypothetical protein